MVIHRSRDKATCQNKMATGGLPPDKTGVDQAVIRYVYGHTLCMDNYNLFIVNVRFFGQKVIGFFYLKISQQKLGVWSFFWLLIKHQVLALPDDHGD